jgi:hypothetical protein
MIVGKDWFTVWIEALMPVASEQSNITPAATVSDWIP